jgi:3-phosphoshikimate 1-carboxyvinyltransferase
VGVPLSLDVRSTALCLAELAPPARPRLQAWAAKVVPRAEEGGYTWNTERDTGTETILELEGEGRSALEEPARPLDCENSATTMRLLAGVLASAPFRSTLIGDDSLLARPMLRVADPLSAMGAHIETEDGHPPMVVEGKRLHGITWHTSVPSAQVKGSILLAGAAADGLTTVIEDAPTRDHTERALVTLGAPVQIAPGRVSVARHQHAGFDARVPGDASAAAFVVAAAALSRSEITIGEVGLNPSRLGYLEVMGRMGIPIEARPERHEAGEPVGELSVGRATGLRAVDVDAAELPLIIDEVPVLAALAVCAEGESSFRGAGELRKKESDRLAALEQGIRALGGEATRHGDDLFVSGSGLTGGVADSAGDHRIGMALTVGALGAQGDSEIRGIEVASVSFPGFVDELRALGAGVEALE